MRQLVSKTPLDKNGCLQIAQNDFVHLRRVLRIKVGDMIFVRLPNGELSSMTVSTIDDAKKIACLQVCTISENTKAENFFRGEQATETACSQIDFTLLQCVLKIQTFELIVRQATECGVKNIIPIASDYSQAQFVKAMQADTRAIRFQKIIKEAREQSGSAIDTKLYEVMTMENALQFLESRSNGARANFVLYERADFCVDMKTLSIGKDISSIALFVGSEGGISPSEIDVLRDRSFIPIHIHDNILKAETAALYGIAVVQARMRD